MTTPETQGAATEDPVPSRAPDAWAIIQAGRIVDVSMHRPRAPGDAGWDYYRQRGFSAPQPLWLGFNDLSPGVVAGLLERQRQITVEGFSAERDDQYTGGQLLKAAAVYLLKAAGLATLRVLPYWPWERSWLKPGDSQRNLEKAFALLVAEMDRRARSESREKSDPSA